MIIKEISELKVGDTLILEIKGVGSGEVSVVEYEGTLHLYEESQGYLPVEVALIRNDIELSKIE